MKKLFAALAVPALIALITIVAPADVPAPNHLKPKKGSGIDSTLSIRLNRNAEEARLIVPRSQLRQLRAELEEMEADPNAAFAGETAGLTKMQTIVSGAFLSLGVLFGGVWLARSRKNGAAPGKQIAAGAVLFFGGVAATIAFANAGPPPEARSISSKLFNRSSLWWGSMASGKIRLEVSDTARDIELIVPDGGEKNGEE